MRKQLRDRGLRDLRMQTADILSYRLLEPQFALLAQLHDARRGKALGVRGNPEPVPGRQLLAGFQIGLTEGEFGDDLATMRDGDDAAGLLRMLHLQFDPAAEVTDRARYPRL